MNETSPNHIEKPYICINCGSTVKELYKKYSSNVLKLTICKNCCCVADKYIEFDTVLIIIDLILLQKEGYRHIIYNTDFKGFWKLTFLILVMESYANWSSTSPTNILQTDEFYIGDFQFYRILSGVAIKHLCFLLTTLPLTYLFKRYYKSKQLLSFMVLIKTFILSSFGIFLLLPALIWDNGVQEFHYIFVLFYTTLSQLFAYEAICNCSKFWSTVVIVLSTIIKLYISGVYDGLEQKFFELLS